jgi:hypothetical protein
MGVGGNSTPQPLYPRERDPVPILDPLMLNLGTKQKRVVSALGSEICVGPGRELCGPREGTVWAPGGNCVGPGKELCGPREGTVWATATIDMSVGERNLLHQQHGQKGTVWATAGIDMSVEERNLLHQQH